MCIEIVDLFTHMHIYLFMFAINSENALEASLML